MIDSNQRNMATGAKVDWMPVMIGTEEQCRAFGRVLQEKRNNGELGTKPK